MKQHRRGFLSSLFGLAAASLSPLTLLLNEQSVAPDPFAGGAIAGWFRMNENDEWEVFCWDSMGLAHCWNGDARSGGEGVVTFDLTRDTPW